MIVLFFTDIDECRSLSTCPNGICLNSEGSYSCVNCPTGFTVSPDGELCEGVWYIVWYRVNKNILCMICIKYKEDVKEFTCSI